MSSNITTSQTIGPFPHEAWRWATELTAEVISSAPQITLRGCLLDGNGAAVNDGWIETWMPQSAALEVAHAIPGSRRVPTDEAGQFSLQISRPAQPTPGEPVAFVTLFARGLVKHQFSAVFLDDDATLTQSAILEQVPAARRDTLIACKQADGSYLWNIHLQGATETVFFDYR